jgi:secernin
MTVPLPLSCDTLVALPSATRDHVTLFAKNSDRPPRECQRLVVLPGKHHAAGARVRCQYIEIPQVGETARVLGSQPHWLWGFEHGVNEHGVTIGNEQVYTREGLGPTGLLGMDLVRLGLERARTAAHALEVMVGLLETHGQGGSGHPDLDWPYHNGFLVCDARSAWVLETSGRHWAAREVHDLGSISNHLSIGSDWDRLGADAIGFADAQGWGAGMGGRFDFAAAYRDRDAVPPHVSEGRYRRGQALLAELRGHVTVATLRTVLRDHYEAGPVYRAGRTPEDAEYFSLCMHTDPLMNTTASMVVRLAPDGAPPVAWASLGTPCTGLFLPYYLDGELPPAVSRGDATPSPDAAWWEFRDLLTRVETDPPARAAVVRAYWDAIEAEVDAAALQVEARAADLRARGDHAGAAELLTAFMTANVRAMSTGLRELAARIAARAR